MMRPFIALLALALAAVGCNSKKPCPDHAECAKQGDCFCDGDGKLVERRVDSNGDKKVDVVRYSHDDKGRVTVIETDFSDNERIERHQEFVYDEQNRRVSNTGWTGTCNENKFHWKCYYDPPCPAPYDACGPCRKNFGMQGKDGKIVPCGEKPEASAKPGS